MQQCAVKIAALLTTPACGARRAAAVTAARQAVAAGGGDEVQLRDAMEVQLNAYGDTVVTGALPTDAAAFRAALRGVVAACTRGTWLTLPFDDDHVALLPVAYELGFRVHHACHGVLTLQAWTLDPARNPTPAYAHHALGAGALVVNSKGQVLGTRERFDTSGKWRGPGGHVDEGELILHAGVREAREETGVDAQPLGIVSFFEQDLPVVPPTTYAVTLADRVKMEQSARFGSTHLSAYVLCVAVDDTLRPDPAEIAEARWLPPDEFIAGAPDHWAGLVATLRACGTLAAAAQVARLRSTTPPPPAAVVAAAEAEARRGLVQGYTLTMRHARYGSTFDATLYNALPPAAVTASLAVGASAAGVAPLLPPPAHASSSASVDGGWNWPLLLCAVAVGVAIGAAAGAVGRARGGGARR